jgi:hypothetical protein
MNGQSSFFNTAVDALVNEGETLLLGIDVLASSAGGDVTVYEGLDAESGRKVGTYKGAANVTNPIRFNPPLFLDRGLFLDIGTNITEVTAQFIPARLD